MPRIIATGSPLDRTSKLIPRRLLLPSSAFLLLVSSIFLLLFPPSLYLSSFLRVYRRVRILSQTLFAVLENFSIGFTLAKLSRYAKDTSVPCCSGHSEKRLPGVCARISQSVCFPAGTAKEENVDPSEDPFSRYSR